MEKGRLRLSEGVCDWSGRWGLSEGTEFKLLPLGDGEVENQNQIECEKKKWWYCNWNSVTRRNYSYSWGQELVGMNLFKRNDLFIWIYFW